MDKIQRATEIHRGMTPHQMAMRIVELQDALDLADEAVRAKHVPGAGNMVSDGWQLVPVEPTRDMLIAINWPNNPTGYAIMLAAAPKLGGE